MVESFTLTGSTLTSNSPYAIVYSALGGDGNIHVYGLNLSNTSAVPSPVQISSLSFAPGGHPLDQSCFFNGYSNGTDPTTAFFIVMLPSANACGTGITTGNSFELIRYTDAPGTAPTTLPAGINTIHAAEVVTSTGVMNGLALVDSSGNLNYFADGGTLAFSSAPTLVASSVTRIDDFEVIVDRSGHALSGGSVAFFVVTAGGAQKIYRIGVAGANSLVYTASGTIGLVNTYDNTNIYFTDHVAAPNTYSFQKAPIASGAAAAVYTTPTVASTLSYGIVDSDGTYLLANSMNTSTTPFTYALTRLTIATSAQVTPYTWAPSPTGSLNAALDYGSDHLFLNFLKLNLATESDVYSPSTNTSPGVAAGTSYQLFTRGLTNRSSVLQFRGLPADNTEGGATLWNINPTSLAATQISNAPIQGGSLYAVPASTIEGFAAVSPTIDIGLAFPRGGAARSGLVVDESKNQLITVSVANTDVQPY